MSRRIGQPKALLELGGRPLIARLVQTFASAASIGRILIVTGHEPQKIVNALDGLDVSFVENSAYETGGMISSVKVGAAAVTDRKVDAFFLALLDQPLVSTRTIEAMAQTMRERRSLIVVPAIGGRHGHPILLSSGCASEIVSLPVDSTLHDFVEQHRAEIEVVEVSDPGVLSNLDTPGDYQVIQRQWRTLTCPTESVANEPA